MKSRSFQELFPPPDLHMDPRGPHRVQVLMKTPSKGFFSPISQVGAQICQRLLRCGLRRRLRCLQDCTLSPPSPAHPLSGLRFGVKDVFDIKGLKTSAGSKIYHQVYPKRDETAPVIAHLVKLGAVIVGKTKNTQFGHPIRERRGSSRVGLTTHVHGIPEVCYHKTSLIRATSILIGQVTGIRTRIPATAEVRQLLQAMTGWTLLSDPILTFFPTSTFETPVRTRFKSTILTAVGVYVV